MSQKKPETGELAPESKLKSKPEGRLLASMRPTVFAAPMGLLGTGHVVSRLGVEGGEPFNTLAQIVFIISGVLLVVLTVLYAARILVIKGACASDFNDPDTMNFGSAFAIAVILAATALKPFALAVAEPVLIFGAAASFGFGCFVVRQWLVLPIAREAISPTWLVPVAGNLVAAKALAASGFELSSLFFAGFGLVGWMMLLPILFYRLTTQRELVARLRPSLFILISPPGLAASAILALHSGPATSMAAGLALSFGLFVLAVLVSMGNRFRHVPPSASWWSYTFPMAAMAMGTLDLAADMESAGLLRFGLLMATFSILVTAGVALGVTKYGFQAWRKKETAPVGVLRNR